MHPSPKDESFFLSNLQAVYVSYHYLISLSSPQSTRHLFTPADRHIPRIRIETRQASTLAGQRIMVAIDGWPKDSRYPNVSPIKLIYHSPQRAAIDPC